MFFTDEPDCSSIVCFNAIANSIISNQLYKELKQNERVAAAGDLIKSEIRWKQIEADVYPSKNDIEMGKNFLQPSMKLQMKYVISNN